MMAEGEDDDIIFVYTGGDQVVPYNVVRVRIAKSVKIIPARAFQAREHLIYVEFHEGIDIVQEVAFRYCYSLRSVKLLGVKVIEAGAFQSCGLSDVVFGDKLETLGIYGFQGCTSLRTVAMPSVKAIRRYAFNNCKQLTELDLSEGLQTIEQSAFCNCQRLRRIAMPLKEDMIGDDAFYNCTNLTVDLVGEIHNTVVSLHLENWRNEMKAEINRINQVLPDTVAEEKTAATQQWIRSVIRLLDHYKVEHKTLLKEATMLLELALWKAKIEENGEESLGSVIAKKAKMDIQSERSERRITSGANTVIKNVLPFLELK